jgi:hypothetical protein
MEELRRAARQRLDLHVASRATDADLARFRAVAGVVEVSGSPGVIHVVVEGLSGVIFAVGATAFLRRDLR